jgi:hypothetical protein
MELCHTNPYLSLVTTIYTGWLPLTYAVVMPAVGLNPTSTCYNPGWGPNPPEDSSCPAMMDSTRPPPVCNYFSRLYVRQ